MSNSATIYDLHSKRPLAANDERLSDLTPQMQQQACDETQAEQSTASAVAHSLGRGLCFVVFHLLNWPSGIVMGLLSLVTFAGLFALAVVGLGMDASPKKESMLLALVVASLGASVLRWCYEVVLIKLQAVIFRI